jgi:hypothetical protein
MLERQERTALFILLGVVGLLLCIHLILAMMGHGAFAAQFTETSQEGELVRLEGIVEEISTTEKGAHSIAVVNGVNVFIPAGIASEITLQQGDAIGVIGVVQIYKGDTEIVVKSQEDVCIRN